MLANNNLLLHQEKYKVLGIEYAPVKVIYFFLRNDADEPLKFVSKKVQSFPNNPVLSDFGFKVKSNKTVLHLK